MLDIDSDTLNNPIIELSHRSFSSASYTNTRPHLRTYATWRICHASSNATTAMLTVKQYPTLHELTPGDATPTAMPHSLSLYHNNAKVKGETLVVDVLVPGEHLLLVLLGVVLV